MTTCAQRAALAALLLLAAGPLALAQQTGKPAARGQAAAAEAPFLAENEAAMNKMMTDMDVKPSGDVNRDFVAMMVPHHEGAVAMARAYLRYGTNEQLRRLAQEIIVTQRQEIAVMRRAIADPSTPAQ